MLTYQDFEAIGQSEEVRMDFVLRLIHEHKSSVIYRTAVIAQDYDRQMNRTINQYQKLLYTMSGKAVPDNFSANYKMASKFFHRFVLQEVQYLLGNGVTWENKNTADKMGEDFDTRLQQLSKNALVGGVAFGFYNLDHMEVFKVTEFAPLYDEENGALMAGVRFWQIDDTKPLRATLYELDGYTDYLWNDGKGEVLKDKKPYKLNVRVSEADGTEIYDGENYPSFPIVPLFANEYKQSEIVGLREQIDAYDLIKSGFANDVDDASQIYWIIQNAGGMDDIDLAKFLERMKVVHAAVVEDGGASAEAHTMDVPYQSREALLERLSKDLYKDAMALDTDNIASGATTATQIRAAYEPLNSKCDDFEYFIHDFLDDILAVAGIEGEHATFTRSKIVNVQEEVQTVLSAATALDSDYVTEKILMLLGDGDKVDEVLRNMDADSMTRWRANERSTSDDRRNADTAGAED